MVDNWINGMKEKHKGRHRAHWVLPRPLLVVLKIMKFIQQGLAMTNPSQLISQGLALTRT